MGLVPVEITIDLGVQGKVFQEFDISMKITLDIGPDQVIGEERGLRDRILPALDLSIDHHRPCKSSIGIIDRCIGSLEECIIDQTIIITQRYICLVLVRRYARADPKPILYLGIDGGMEGITVEV